MVSSEEKFVFHSPIKIRFRGTYDYDGLLNLIRGYYGRHFFDRKEPKLKYKSGGGGAEVEFKMEADRKVTHYIKVFLYVEGHLWDVNPKEVVVDGKKQMLTGGKLEIQLKGSFELDYGNSFATHDNKSSSGRFQNMLEKHMQKFLDEDGQGLQFGDNKANGKKYMEGLLIDFADEIKKFLKMECS